MRKRKQRLRLLGVFIQIATLGAVVVALVLCANHSRRLGSVEADVQANGRQIRALGGGTERDGRGARTDLPSDWARGGRLAIGLRQRPSALNPLLIQEADAYSICDLVCETLVRRDLDSAEFRPSLAASWEVSDDHLVYTFHLNPLAYFSDGQPVTPDDVVFTFEMLRDRSVGGRCGAAFFTDLKQVRSVGPVDVEFRFSRPYFLALASIASRHIVPRHVYDLPDRQWVSEDEYRRLLVGSGPFVLEPSSFSLTTDTIVLKRNDSYWDRGRSPALDFIEFRIVEEDRRAFQLLKTGGIDTMYLSPEQFREADADENFSQHYRLFRFYAPQTGLLYIGWNNRREPLDDARVRRALAHLIPRQQMAHEIYKDLARVVDVPFWSGGPQYPSQIEPLEFDPAAAGQLLDEVGWTVDSQTRARRKDGRPLEIRLLVVKREKRDDTLADFFVAEAAKAGVAVKVERAPWSQVRQRIETGDFQAVLMGWTASFETDPYLFWHSSQAGPGGLNQVGFSNPEADRLTEAIRHELDAGTRNRLCHELGRLLVQEQPYTMLLEPETLVAVRAKFGGVRRYRLGLRPREWYIPRRP